LAQHADARPEFQRRGLGLLTDAVDRGEADASDLVYLTDRVLCGDGGVMAPSSGPDPTAPACSNRGRSTTATIWTSAARRWGWDRSPSTSGTCSTATTRAAKHLSVGGVWGPTVR
jgi:hypothetical protein